VVSSIAFQVGMLLMKSGVWSLTPESAPLKTISIASAWQ